MDESGEYIVQFEKSEEYNRYHITGVLTSTSKDMFSITLFEETQPLISSIRLKEDVEPEVILEKGNLINLIHASVVISPKNLPGIIKSLQDLYNTYTIQSDGE